MVHDGGQNLFNMALKEIIIYVHFKTTFLQLWTVLVIGWFFVMAMHCWKWTRYRPVSTLIFTTMSTPSTSHPSDGDWPHTECQHYTTVNIIQLGACVYKLANFVNNNESILTGWRWSFMTKLKHSLSPELYNQHVKTMFVPWCFQINAKR